MTVLSFCPSRSNIWILELHIWNTLPVGRGLEADPTVKEAWVVERQRREEIKLVWVFFHLFIYMEMVYFLLFFSLFAQLGHLGGGVP